MSSMEMPKGADLAVRCHDVAVSLDGRQVGEFEDLVLLGMAVRLALQMRGLPAVPYELLRKVGLHLVKIPATSFNAVLKLLEEAEFVRVVTSTSGKAVIPTVPYYEDFFEQAGAVANSKSLNEHEQLTLMLVNQLANSPTPLSSFYNLGAEKKLVDSATTLGRDAGYLSVRRARGKNVLTSPIYFAEHADAFADLVAGAGSNRVTRVLSLLATHQGWPFQVILSTGKIGEEVLSQEDLNIVRALAGEGFAAPPAIQTPHSGLTHFLFSPQRTSARLRPTERHLHEAAMALVAAVRQGQLLPAAYRIRSPKAILNALRDRGFIRANTESRHQYNKLAVLRVGRLEHVSGDWYKFVLLETEEAREVVNRALALISNDAPRVATDEEITMALMGGEDYFDSLIGRQRLVQQSQVTASEETMQEINDLLLRGMP
ncbi:hypothetical protein LZ198_41250 [Myxococcus sp. K15C18031901]|uniref:hypothetical protein n=1 Tax=Myxococcus dinghuensis TaxID=2906761 RepID=UPI0020A7C6F1|nr:hypothetical protein [Myxococcus dinghuensis]MCP3105314.1 hypothetical protein [Myxococcus dinghuensis]